MPQSTPQTISVLDACVLYPPFLRDLLMRLAVVGVYEPRWSDEIHGEWKRNVLTDNPHIISSQLDRTIRLMNLAVPTAMESGYERHIPALNLPDINDRHVLATAIEGGASVIVTFNLKDFPVSVLRDHRIERLHPDIFLSALYDHETDLFLEGVRRHREALHRPHKSATEYILTLRENGLRSLTERIEAHIDAI